jgi:hypothetical protein
MPSNEAAISLPGIAVPEVRIGADGLRAPIHRADAVLISAD